MNYVVVHFSIMCFFNKLYTHCLGRSYDFWLRDWEEWQLSYFLTACHYSRFGGCKIVENDRSLILWLSFTTALWRKQFHNCIWFASQIINSNAERSLWHKWAIRRREGCAAKREEMATVPVFSYGMHPNWYLLFKPHAAVESNSFQLN